MTTRSLNVKTEMHPPAPKITAAPHSSQSSDNVTNRRSSSRSIKRKRFDDEIVEYCLNSQQSRDVLKGQKPRKSGVSGASSSSRVITATPAQLPPPKPLAPPQPPALLPLSTKPLPLPSAIPPMPVAIPPPPAAPAPRSINNKRKARSVKETEVSAAKKPATNVTANNATRSTTTNPNATNKELNNSSSKNNNTSIANNNNNNTNQNNANGNQYNVEKRRNNTNRGTSLRQRKLKRSGRPSSRLINENLGRWKPLDDLTLITDVLQTNDLRAVFHGTKFSCKFSFPELQARWFSLLYEPAISRIAMTGMRNLHPELVKSVQRRALFSEQEEEILSSIKSTESPKIAKFKEVLHKHPATFHGFRTPKTLQIHWQRMKEFRLLSDQVAKPIYDSDHPLSFSDAEDIIMDTDLLEQRDDTLEVELALADRKNKRKIRILENEISRWNVLVESVLGTKNAEFDGQTLAIITGRFVRFLMRSKEITFGREGKGFVVDVDLSLEGPATKISRRQGTIKLRSNGDFFVSNDGKRPFFINGVPLLPGSKTRLSNNCILELCHLRFVFLVNYDLINAIRFESAKTTGILN